MKLKASNVEKRRRKNQKKDPVVRSNPFELRINKQKFAILGRKSKNDRGLPGLSRSKAIKKRKSTLLQEYKQGNKVSSFLDKRFGEYDTELSLEERMLQRFTLEKQKHHESRKLYNLDDDEDLTHYGQSLGEMTNFDDADLQLTDDEKDADRTDEDNFGGFLKKVDRPLMSDEGEKQKSKKEIMEDIVAKSKLKKFERQQAKEEAFQLTQDLDADWKMIQSLLHKRDDNEMTQADDYDVLVNELKFETKAKPKERMKTEEEIAKAEKEKLERLEAERLERMHLKDTYKPDHLSADYLGDSIVVKEDKRLELTYKDGKAVLPEGISELRSIITQRGDVEVEDGEEDDEDDGEEDEEEEEEEEEDDDDEEDDEDDEEDDEDDEEGDEDNDEENDEQEEEEDKADLLDMDSGQAKEIDQDMIGSAQEGAKSRVEDKPKDERSKTGKASEELPFTFSAPNDLNEFIVIVSNWSWQDQLCIIDRIRKCHPAKLEEKNKKHMEVLFIVLLQYIDHLCDQDSTPFSFINKLAKPLMDIVKDSPLHCTHEVQNRIRRIFKKFWIRHKTAGGRNAMPGIKEIILLNIVSKIFPTSDLKHCITSPAIIYMAAVLSKASFDKSCDLISGLFLSNTIFEFVSLSKRFVPEVINFITGIISLATKPDENLKYKPSIRMNFKNRNCLCLHEKTQELGNRIHLSEVGEAKKEALRNLSLATRVSILRNALHLTKKFADLYRDLPSFTEVFDPAKQLLAIIPKRNYAKEMQKDFSELMQLLKNETERQPLTLLARKPTPLPLLEPKFDENYEIKSKKRLKDKDANERNKLKYKLKNEMKGAIREIRKDSQFLAKEKLQERIERDKERTRKTKEIERELGQQQGELKALDKLKKKKR